MGVPQQCIAESLFNSGQFIMQCPVVGLPVGLYTPFNFRRIRFLSRNIECIFREI